VTVPAARGGRLLLLTALAAVAFHALRAAFFPAPPPDVRRALPAVFPEALRFSERGGDPPHWTAATAGPAGAPLPIGSVVSSADLAPGVRGYAGPVPVLVGVKPDGTITGVAVLENHETPAYAARVEQGGFLRQFAGKSVRDPLRIGEDVDAVTRATVTSAAVTEAARLSARAAASRIHGLPVPPESGGGRPLPWVRLAAVLALIALGAAALLLGRPALRWTALLGGLAVLGWWQGAYLSAPGVANVLLGRWPPLREGLPWYALFGASVACAVAWRNLYCTALCPFGALQEILHRATTRRLDASPAEDRAAGRLRVAFLWLATMAVFLFDRAEAAHYEPFSTAFDFKGGWARWTLLAAVLLLAAVRRRFWCRYFCPTGTCLQLLGRWRTATPYEDGPRG
jgi:hypothetical protein